MKKNISINLQGLIFHIEEDGFEVLSRYLAEVKAHFANYRGHQDIVADIEGRIAELFSARLSPMQQVITLDDVNAMTAKMGRVSDFAPDADEDDEATTEPTNASAGFGSPAGSFGSATAAPAAAVAAAAEPKRLYRDMANRKIAGVAAGIAQYFAVNPLWIRLGFVVLAVLSPAVWRVFDDFGDTRFNLRLGSWALLGYIVLWIVLPKRYDAPAHPEALLNSGPLAGRRLFRDTGTGKVAGVAAGLAAYFNIDVTLVRVLLIAGLLLGFSTIPLYIILWIVLPEAKTVSDKLRMRGDAMTLESFDSSMRNNALTDGPTLTNRPVGAFVEDAARSLRPLVDFVGSAIRIAAGVLLTIGGFSLLLMLAILLGAGIGLIPNSENIVAGDVPAHVLLNGIPAWGLLAGFLAAGIPALWMLLGGLNLLFKRTLLPRTVGLSLLGLWLLSVVGLTMAIARQSRQYQYDAEVEQLERYPALTAPVLKLDSRNVDRQWEQHVDVRLAAADSGKTVEVLRTLGAKGPNEAEARRTALTTINYMVRPSGDSSLVFDDHFSFLPGAAYRKQELALTLRLPRDRTFRLSRGFAYDLLDEDDFVGNRRPNDPDQHRYRLRGNQLECIACTPEQLGRNEENEGNVNINTDDTDDTDDTDGTDGDRDNIGLSLNYGGAPSFDTDLNSYGGARRTFEETGFSRVSVAGGYRVVVRRGGSFKVEAGGDSKALNDLRMERNGDELQIRPRSSTGFFGGDWNRKQHRVLIRVELPALSRLELAGANLKTRNSKVSIAGVCKARLHVTESLEGDAVGASEVAYSGQPNRVKLDATGPSSIKRL